MKILHTADWHVGRTVRGRSRIQEHREVLEEILDIARLHQVDLVLVAGDLFDSAAPSPEAEDVVYTALLELADTGAHVVLVAGNHDHPRRLQAVKPLLDRAARIHTGAVPARPDDGGVIRVTTAGGEEAQVALFPFLSQRQIVRADELMSQAGDEHAQTYADRCSRILRSLCAAFGGGCVNLIVAHLMVLGAEPGGGERSVHSGLDYAVPAGDLPARGVHYVALGHIHKAQPLPANLPVWYSGSPLQLDFGDSEMEKCVILIEATAETPAVTRRIPLRSGRRLRTLKGAVAQLESQAGRYQDDFLRVVVDESPRVGLADEVRELLPNAVEVRLAESEQDRGRSEFELGPDLSPRQLFAEFLRERDRCEEALLESFDSLLEEVHEAEAS